MLFINELGMTSIFSGMPLHFLFSILSQLVKTSCVCLLVTYVQIIGVLQNSYLIGFPDIFKVRALLFICARLTDSQRCYYCTANFSNLYFLSKSSMLSAFSHLVKESYMLVFSFTQFRTLYSPPQKQLLILVMISIQLFFLDFWILYLFSVLPLPEDSFCDLYIHS